MKFIFDLDGTVTSVETLPLIAAHFGIEAEIDDITAKTISGNIPFVESFIQRVGILSKRSVVETADILARAPLFEQVQTFIKDNRENCVIATGNLDVWIDKLAARLGCNVRSSVARVKNDRVEKITDILRKENVVREMQADGEMVVYIGDGNNDAEAMRIADISIAVGLVHEPAQSVLAVCDFLVYSEAALIRLLDQIRNHDSPQTANTLVLSCAGIGTRLGLNSTKALINFESRPLVQWQMD